MNPYHPVVILAAGASRRMGTPKPLLDFDGTACLDLVVAACREAGCRPIVVVLGAEAKRIQDGCRRLSDATVVVNDDWERGQTSSVKAALRSLPGGTEAFFVLPADHALVRVSDFGALVAGLDGRAGASIAIPTFDGRRGHPILIAGSHREGILAMGDDAPLHDYIRPRARETALVPIDHAGVVTGMNTPEDYHAALAAHRRLAAR